jgi:hypothetical protein
VDEFGGHVVCIGEKRHTDRFWLYSPKERDRLEDISVDGKKILKWIPKNSRD